MFRTQAGKSPDGKGVVCLACQADTVSPKGVQCVKCSGAKQPNKAKTACMPCPAGHVFSAAKLVCLACPASKAPSEDPRVQGCVCAAGYYNSSTIRLRCIDDQFQGAAKCAAAVRKISMDWQGMDWQDNQYVIHYI